MVCPGVVLVHEERGVVGLRGLTVGVDGISVRGRAAQAVGGDSAHEEAVVAAQRDARAGVRGRGDRAVVTQDVVGDGTGHGGPLEGDLLGVAARRAQVCGHGGCGGVARGHAHEAAGPLSRGERRVGVVEVAACPQRAVVAHFEGPRAGETLGGQAVGGPAELAARGLVPAADPLDFVGARPGGAQRQVVVGVLEGEVGAVARGVDDTRGGAGARLNVSAVLHGDGTRGAGHRVGVVSEERVLRAAEVHAAVARGDGLLVLADQVGVLEGPGRVQRSAGGCGQSTRIFDDQVVRAREVAGSVVVGLVFVNVDINDGAVELGVPRAVGLAVDIEARAVTGIGPRRTVALEVREDTAQVDVVVDDLDGLHRDAATVGAGARLQGPRRVNLTGRRVDQNRADVGLTIDPGEVAGHEELAARQLSEVLDLVVEGEGLSVPLPRRRIEAGETRGCDLLAVLTLLHAGEVTADVHGRADLLEGLDLDIAFLVGTVEVAGHAPRHRRGELRSGVLLLFGGRAAVADGAEAGIRRAQLRADVGLGVGVDDRAVVVEVRRRGGRVGPRRGERAVTPAHRVLVLRGGRQVDVSPASVRAEARPDDAAVDPPLAVELHVHGVGALKGPDEVAHLREAHAYRLVGGAPVVPGALDHDAVIEVGDRGAAEQAVDGFVRGLDDVEVAGRTRTGLELLLVALPLAPRLPAFAAATDHDPATAVSGLVAEELTGRVHGGRLQPVGSVLRAGIILLDFPARGRCRGLAQAVVKRVGGCVGSRRKCKHAQTGH